MFNENPIPLDVAVVGGGPAGISACLELSNLSERKVALFETASELGGMPRSCHMGFGMRDLKRFYSGPKYAKKIDNLVRKTGVDIYTEATVLNLKIGHSGESHQIDVLSQEGLRTYACRSLLLATGCSEISYSARDIPSKRPEGIFTTGTLQQMVNLQGLKPGKRALIVGSEHIALSCILTLRRSGMAIAGMVEEEKELQSYSSMGRIMGAFHGFPIFRDTRIMSVLGSKRVAGVELSAGKTGKEFHLKCDTIVVTGKFRPVSKLIENTPIERDPATMGPVVDWNLMTSIPNIFAAGNAVRGAHMNDLCALEGRYAARSILRKLTSAGRGDDEMVSIRSEPPLRYAVPQKIPFPRARRSSFLSPIPGVAVELERTLKKPVLQAWSGGEKIWENWYSRLIGNSRIPLPIRKFDWKRVDPQSGITVIAKGRYNSS